MIQQNLQLINFTNNYNYFKIKYIKIIKNYIRKCFLFYLFNIKINFKYKNLFLLNVNFSKKKKKSFLNFKKNNYINKYLNKNKNWIQSSFNNKDERENLKFYWWKHRQLKKKNYFKNKLLNFNYENKKDMYSNIYFLLIKKNKKKKNIKKILNLRVNNKLNFLFNFVFYNLTFFLNKKENFNFFIKKILNIYDFNTKNFTILLKLYLLNFLKNQRFFFLFLNQKKLKKSKDFYFKKLLYRDKIFKNFYKKYTQFEDLRHGHIKPTDRLIDWVNLIKKNFWQVNNFINKLGRSHSILVEKWKVFEFFLKKKLSIKKLNLPILNFLKKKNSKLFNLIFFFFNNNYINKLFKLKLFIKKKKLKKLIIKKIYSKFNNILNHLFFNKKIKNKLNNFKFLTLKKNNLNIKNLNFNNLNHYKFFKKKKKNFFFKNFFRQNPLYKVSLKKNIFETWFYDYKLNFKITRGILGHAKYYDKNFVKNNTEKYIKNLKKKTKKNKKKQIKINKLFKFIKNCIGFFSTDKKKNLNIKYKTHLIYNTFFQFNFLNIQTFRLMKKYMPHKRFYKILHYFNYIKKNYKKEILKDNSIYFDKSEKIFGIRLSNINFFLLKNTIPLNNLYRKDFIFLKNIWINNASEFYHKFKFKFKNKNKLFNYKLKKKKKKKFFIKFNYKPYFFNFLNFFLINNVKKKKKKKKKLYYIYIYFYFLKKN